MKTQLIFLMLLFCLSMTSAFGQYSETIVSDRPGQSNSPYTVGKMVLQLQTGAHIGGANADNYKENNFSMPALFRFGITDKIEVQTHWGYQNEKATQNDFENTSKGINLAHFGLKFNIFEESDKAPALGFEVNYKTKMNSKDYKTDYPATKLNLIASKTLSNLLSVTANLGADFDGNSGRPNGFYTANLVLAVNEELSVLFENYGDFNGDYFNTFFDFGGAYILNENLQLDLYGGFGYNDDVFSYLVSAGVSYRITKWSK